MQHISLGGLDVSRIGLGTMAMSGYYLDPGSSDAESVRTIQRALDLGVTHIDTAEIYGPYANEELVGRAIKRRRDDVVVATPLRPRSMRQLRPTTSGTRVPMPGNSRISGTRRVFSRDPVPNTSGLTDGPRSEIPRPRS